jgi:hypothetical protein
VYVVLTYLDNVISWLSVVDYTSVHLAASKLSHSGTGEWFISAPEFKLWLEGGSADERLIWLTGIGETCIDLTRRSIYAD